MSLNELSLAGIFKLLPARASLVSDILAGNGETANLIHGVSVKRNASRALRELNFVALQINKQNFFCEIPKLIKFSL
jgi:hypothetical protein